MANINDYECMVVRSLAGQADTLAPTAGSFTRRVHRQLYRSTVLTEQTAGRSVDVINVARGGIRILKNPVNTDSHWSKSAKTYGKEGETVQEITTGVIILQAGTQRRKLEADLQEVGKSTTALCSESPKLENTRHKWRGTLHVAMVSSNLIQATARR